ncbi:MAG TPA: glycosyltransferase family 39 protein [Thermoanaerobaculaceae bacterium]|nr:glycosyltransferase family 39 protein [Thermoanaerobaculaceae bacterium]HRS16007.1 glycosyltransferase family 39 protein [Thermoanaerobaculaceae bacterium]
MTGLRLRPGLALVVPAALALALAGTGAWVRPPWHDEYFTAWAARLPWSDLLAALRLDSGPPLLYALSRLATLLGLPALGAARAVAALCGAGAVALVAATARSRWGGGAAWTAGLLLAFHPLALHWSCEGRAYALLLFAAAWGWFELTRMEGGLPRAWRLGIAVALGCWSHSLGLLLASALAAACVALPVTVRRRGLVAIAAGLASHLPWLPVMLGQPPAAIAWMAHLWEQLAIPRSMALAIGRYLSPVAAFGGVLDLPSPPLAVEVAGAVLTAALLGLALCRPGEVAIPALGVGVPAAAFAALVLASVPVFYPGRAHVLLLAPFAVLLAAPRGKAARMAAALLVAGGLAVSLRSVAAWAAEPEPIEARLARRLRAELPAGGTVVVGGIWRLGLDYHLGGGSPRLELVSVPEAAGRHPGWYVDGHDRLQPGELEALARRLGEQPGRAAVLVAPGADTAPALRQLAARLGLAPAAEVPGGVLYLPSPHRRGGGT